MIRKHICKTSLCAAFVAGAIGSPAQANEYPPNSNVTGNLSQLVFGETNLTDGRVLSEEELGIERGGFGGVYFTLFGYGDINQVGSGLPEGVTLASQSADLVSMNLGLASLPNTGGFIQFASVVGNNNIVNNNLVLNVYFLEGGVADTSNIANGAIFGF